MNTHRIHRVAKLTGLSKDVIRVWERRYGLVKPSRSANRYRIYTDDEVALLRYVKAQMDQGQTIGDLVAIGREQLVAEATRTARTEASETQPYERLLHELIGLLNPLRRESFERRLNGAVAVIPFEEAIFGILLPLQTRVGQLWHDGHLNVAVEHYVTNQVRQKLFAAMSHLPVHEKGLSVVVACPVGEFHEVGAQAAAYLCASRGCQTYYLGANMPLDQLAIFCRQIDPDVLLLSVTVPPPAHDWSSWIATLRDLTAPHRTILIGGAAAHSLVLPVGARRIEILNELPTLEQRLTVLMAKQAVRVR
ncbi:MAG: MerR family transcriptional regulator [Nitrospira sp.]|jgi:DNA-binding transcriptional MerR regulator/methylmalonyl-CoA mutase cobalamin-binding subunit|nr:MerR family transcriptional regulator [Nitrospira sp.]MDI3463844.1 Transcriptional regulator [Nitrospira sp.]